MTYTDIRIYIYIRRNTTLLYEYSSYVYKVLLSKFESKNLSQKIYIKIIFVNSLSNNYDKLMSTLYKHYNGTRVVKF